MEVQLEYRLWMVLFKNRIVRDQNLHQVLVQDLEHQSQTDQDLELQSQLDQDQILEVNHLQGVKSWKINYLMNPSLAKPW